jgi:regulatory protein
VDDPCYIAALRILNYRFNSEGELRRKLRGKKFEKDAIETTIARLHKERWLDDERFAGAFVRTRISKGLGRLRIRRELSAAGVSEEAANEALAKNVDEEREREDLAAACRKRMRALARRHGDDFLDTEQGRTKVAAWLVGRGYDTALVWETLRRELASSR